MTTLLAALDRPAPSDLGDLGGVWDADIRSALSSVVNDPVERHRTMTQLSDRQAWALLSWAEGACTLAVRTQSAALIRACLQALSLVDGTLDRHDIQIVSALAVRAADLLGTNIADVTDSQPSLRSWIEPASPALPSSHVEFGHGSTFEFRRKRTSFDLEALERSLRDDNGAAP